MTPLLDGSHSFQVKDIERRIDVISLYLKLLSSMDTASSTDSIFRLLEHPLIDVKSTPPIDFEECLKKGDVMSLLITSLCKNHDYKQALVHLKALVSEVNSEELKLYINQETIELICRQTNSLQEDLVTR